MNEYPCEFDIGDQVFVTGDLSTHNTVGGTEVLKHGGVECVITKSFWDYEAGWRFFGRVVDEGDVDDFRGQATSRFTADDYKEKYPKNPNLYITAVAALKTFDPSLVYFSEHDIGPVCKKTNSVIMKNT